MIWPNSMEKRWFRRFVSLVSLTLGNSVSWVKLHVGLPERMRTGIPIFPLPFLLNTV